MSGTQRAQWNRSAVGAMTTLTRSRGTVGDAKESAFPFTVRSKMTAPLNAGG
jgi:hypothetical protein